MPGSFMSGEDFMFSFLINTAVRAAAAVARTARSAVRRMRRCLRGLWAAHLRLSRMQPAYMTALAATVAALVGELSVEELVLGLLTAGLALAGISSAPTGPRSELAAEWF
jgi:hypothetical protein